MSVSTRAGREVSHYRIEQLLGSGGMGDVYRAADLRLGRRVALKFLRPLSDSAARQRLLREAHSVSLLDHPNICTVFEIDETPEGEVFVAMAYYDGETLDRILARGPIGHRRALSIAIQAGRGLAAAHEELIVHRDIKPANLMITRHDMVKILDFGLAKQLSDVTTTREDSIVGTVAYMAPEQLRGEGVDHRADIWSLGAVLHEMATGATPFGAQHLGSVVGAILSDEPFRARNLPVDVPPTMARVLERALAKNLRLRYERIDDMVQDLLETRAAVDSEAVVRPSRALQARSSIAVLPFQSR